MSQANCAHARQLKSNGRFVMGRGVAFIVFLYNNQSLESYRIVFSSLHIPIIYKSPLLWQKFLFLRAVISDHARWHGLTCLCACGVTQNITIEDNWALSWGSFHWNAPLLCVQIRFCRCMRDSGRLLVYFGSHFCCKGLGWWWVISWCQ